VREPPLLRKSNSPAWGIETEALGVDFASRTFDSRPAVFQKLARGFSEVILEFWLFAVGRRESSWAANSEEGGFDGIFDASFSVPGLRCIGELVFLWRQRAAAGGFSASRRLCWTKKPLLPPPTEPPRIRRHVADCGVGVEPDCCCRALAGAYFASGLSQVGFGFGARRWASSRVKSGIWLMPGSGEVRVHGLDDGVSSCGAAFGILRMF